ncbi:unnamed protein product [Strongylus vulgaris]|uniref:DNA methyltransferase 1-associated 1 domain-containing protein n=1 Tax=Strongylus vulgaris TaxID=40348 RepID=A0A3P7KI52_STRVU|nr:unnamed protein product [Strongylus vulgaris]
MLLAELKRIEVRKREREKKAQDLQKLINMAEAPASPSQYEFMRHYLINSLSFSFSFFFFLAVERACRLLWVRRRGRCVKKQVQLQQIARQPLTSILSVIQFILVELLLKDAIQVDISVSAIRFPEFKSAGAHLRSQEMKLPTNIGQKKLKNIEVVLSKCKLDMNPMGTEAIVSAYNEFRSQIILLLELKSTLQTAEFELETLRNRMVEEGKEPFEIEPRMRISTVPEGGLDPDEVTGDEGAPATTRRITSCIDTSSSANPLLIRKRKLGVGSLDGTRSRRT